MSEFWSRQETACWGRHQRVLSGGRTITQQADDEDRQHDRGDEGPRLVARLPKKLVTVDDGDEPDAPGSTRAQTREEKLASFRAMAARFGVPQEHRHAIKAALARGLAPGEAREAGIQAWLEAAGEERA